MAESACLHIKAHETDPVRVVEIPGASVRIGRAPYCEVQLTEPELAEEECLLSRDDGDGGTWHLLPAHPDGAVEVEGHALDEPRVVSFDVPFRVGDHWLTLRPTAPADDAPDPADDTPAPGPARAEAPADRLARVQALEAQRESWHQARVEEKRWEERWKAAGDRLKTRAAASAAPKVSTIAPPPTPPTLRPERPGLRVRDAARRPDVTAGLTAVAPPVAPLREVPRVTRDPLSARDWASYATPTRRDPRPGFASVTALRAAPEPPRPRREAAPGVARPPAAPTIDPEPPRAKDVAPEPTVGTALALLPAAPAVPATLTAPRFEDEDETVDVESFPVPIALAPPAWRMLATQALEPCEEPTPMVDLLGPIVEAEPAVVEADPIPEAPIAELLDSSPEPEGWETAVPASPETDPVEGDSPTVAVEPPPSAAPTPEPVAPLAVVRPRTASRRPRGSTVRARKSGARRPSPSLSERPREPLTIAPPEPIGFAPAPDAAAPSWTVPPAREWPTVQDILAAHRGAPSASAAEPGRPPRTRRASEPELTSAREPARWNFPLWLGWFPMFVLALVIGPIGIGAAWTWSRSAYAAGQVANRLARPDAKLTPLPDAIATPATSWWKTSAGNLAQWVLYQRRLPEADAAGAEQVREWLDAASHASPVQVQVRLALATPEAAGRALPLYRRLGLSRDVLALAWSGHQLLEAGKKNAARDVYRRALELACRADLARLDRPAFDESTQVRRYTLPYERLIGPVIRGMSDSPRWTVAEWTEALPDSALVRLVAARRLRERGDPGADALLDAVIAQQPGGALEGRPDPMHLAAQAEALALKGRWNEAQEHYQRAVELMPDDLVRRSWWINLADIALRLDDEAKRRKALEVAKGSEHQDEISRRAVDQLKYLGTRDGGTRAGRSKS